MKLLCVDAFPGIEPFHGLGQLQPDQLASLYTDRESVTDAQFEFAVRVDKAFATQDPDTLTDLSNTADAPLRWIPAAVVRWLQERPDPVTGLGRLEALALMTIRDGSDTPGKIFASVAARDRHPQFWGDTTFTLVTGKTESPSKSEHSKSWKAGYHHERWGWSSNGLRTIRRSCFETGSWLDKTSA